MKVLSISPIAVYDNVGHAGGKTHNYYLKRLFEENGVELKLLAFSKLSEVDKVDYDKYGIENDIILSKGNTLYNLYRVFKEGLGVLSLRTKTRSYYSEFKKSMVLKKLREYKKSGYSPDIIILEWTEFVLLVDYIKKIYPSAKYIASEHDVSFLGELRKIDSKKGEAARLKQKQKYEKLLKNELSALKMCDIVMPHNSKDAKLLIENGIDEEKINVLTPYFMDMSTCEWVGNKKQILFFGAMAREANYASAIWFIENVLYNLKDKEVKFVVLGGNPHKELLKYKSERVIITGFVDDVKHYFEESMCFAAPLVMGAGIKVKIIEALSSGIPVITNEIGIEGIPAIKNKDYIHCETAKEYIDTINKLLESREQLNEIHKNCEKFVQNNFSLEKSYEQLIARFDELMQ